MQIRVTSGTEAREAAIPGAASRARTRAVSGMHTLLAGCLLAGSAAGQQFGPELPLTHHADNPRSVLAADLDGDGDRDVLSASLGDDKIAWYENEDGLGGFGPQQLITTLADGARAVVAADLDGDGDADVLSASKLDDEVAWYENLDGLGTFGPQQIVTAAAGGATSIFAADLDGDGDPDVLAAAFDGDEVLWCENASGTGSFGPPQVISTAVDAPHSVFAADLDGDGDPDALSASIFDDRIAWYENAGGTGSFGAQQLISTAADFPESIHAADLDGDGDSDVLSASDGDDKVAWYENTDGLGSFGFQKIITTGAEAAFAVTAADLDGDGDQDALSASIADDAITWYANTDGLGSFGPPVQVIADAVHYPQSVFAADLDGDGDQDALAASFSDGRVVWIENTGGAGTPWPLQTITTSAPGVRSVHSADLDGDGDPDVLSASYFDDRIAWYENAGAPGSFGAQQTIATTAEGAYEVFAADLDGDGDLDVLAASADDDQIAWYANQSGAGVFGPEQVVSSAADGAWSVFAADLDGDGDEDVLSASAYDQKVAWYENAGGPGVFGPQMIIEGSANGASSVFAADLDGDGDRDALSASTYDATVAWYENSDGQGGFGPRQVITLDASGAESVHAADLDGDGDRDVLSASTADHTVAWHENTDGLGAFGPRQILSNTAPGANSVTAADLDGDGFADVLACSALDDEVAWFANLHESLVADVAALPLSTGGLQQLTLSAGAERGLLPYLLLGSLSGTEPGFPIDGLVLPLNADAYTVSTLIAPNAPPLAGSFGTLNAQGKASASFTLAPGLPPTLIGLTLHHAYVVLELLPSLLQVAFASDPVPLALVP